MKGSLKLASGIVEIELFDREAPGTVANFAALAREGFYDGLPFHRVVYGFVAQGGKPDEPRKERANYSIPCEAAGNTSKHVRGVVSMAHSGPNTGNVQFFIAYSEQPHLNGLHTIFGRVVSGMEFVDGLKRGDLMIEVKVWDE
ncbi:peptidylprolyl isomerase [Paenibacillaceae bacterium WGS1546]|uniref:peptidylprolyl isomerase n=1 Tax=Cohnella sp. WGS1546 TaxID=3366810 RepID=UPI00372D1EFA